MEEEIWLPAWHFERYEVSNKGGIRHAPNMPLKQNSRTPVSTYTDDEGYLVARLWIGREAHERRVEDLVRESFVGWDI